uniref:Proline rich 13 n=1 Tax=Cebus imitator TaxID=2715852 RepID=A0A2K5RR22_CEBIM
TWNPNAGRPGPNPYLPNTGYPGGSDPAHPPPINPLFPPGLLRPPPGAPQGNPTFPPEYPGCQLLGPYSPPYPPPAPEKPPVNPMAPGMVGPGVTVHKKMQKAHKKMHKHHKYGKHASSSSSD